MKFTTFLLFNLLTGTTLLMMMMEMVQGKPSIFLIETADAIDNLKQDAETLYGQAKQTKGDDYFGSGVPIWIPKANGQMRNMANVLFG